MSKVFLSTVAIERTSKRPNGISYKCSILFKINFIQKILKTVKCIKADLNVYLSNGIPKNNTNILQKLDKLYNFIML